MEENINCHYLIIKFLSREISEAELMILKEWLERDPVNRRVFDRENEVWQESRIQTKFEYFTANKAWSDISKQIGIGENKNKKIKVLSRSGFRMILTAASFLFLVMFGLLTLWLIEMKDKKSMEITTTRISTEPGEKARVFLSDSTFVALNSGSSLEYASGFNIYGRFVKLKGEAYFDVRTNPEKPFVVQAGKMTVMAVGTKFNVYSHENEDRSEATLEEGNIKISVMNNDPFDLKPGQQLVYFPKTNKTLVRDVSTETYTSWKENKLRFIDAPFEEVLRQISRRYNVLFEVRGKELLALRYTATFIDESIEDVMEMLEEVSPIKYKIFKRTTIRDKQYLKPKIIVESNKEILKNKGLIKP